jgi:hypothetical protein
VSSNGKELLGERCREGSLDQRRWRLHPTARRCPRDLSSYLSRVECWTRARRFVVRFIRLELRANVAFAARYIVSLKTKVFDHIERHDLHFDGEDSCVLVPDKKIYISYARKEIPAEP